MSHSGPRRPPGHHHCDPTSLLQRNRSWGWMDPVPKTSYQHEYPQQQTRAVFPCGTEVQKRVGLAFPGRRNHQATARFTSETRKRPQDFKRPRPPNDIPSPPQSLAQLQRRTMYARGAPVAREITFYIIVAGRGLVIGNFPELLPTLYGPPAMTTGCRYPALHTHTHTRYVSAHTDP